MEKRRCHFSRDGRCHVAYFMHNCNGDKEDMECCPLWGNKPMTNDDKELMIILVICNLINSLTIILLALR